VDIEKGAVDIARLRFWLSLIVDENTPRPLPNLDYKIVVGDSLLSKFEDEVIDIDWTVNMSKGVGSTREIMKDQELKLYDLQHKQHLYFHVKGDKTKLQQEIRNLKIDILINQLTLSRLSFVQANPKLGGFAPTAKEIQKNLETEIRIAGYDKTIGKLKKLKENKTAALHFFDWKLDFPEVMNEKVVKGDVGFDIVIANPPYGVEYNEATKMILKKKYPGVQQKMFDSFLFFIALAKIINKLSGCSSFIVPNNLIFQMTYEKGREFLLKQTTLRNVINLGDNVFAQADVPTCIFITFNRQLENYNFGYLDLRKDDKNIFTPSRFKFEIYSKKNLEKTHSFVFGVNAPSLSLINKLSTTCQKLGYVIANASYGIGTGGDKIFRISNTLCEELKLEKDLLFNVYSGSNISRYKISYEDEKIIYTTKSIQIENYPRILNYLLPHKEKLSQKRETKKGILPWWCLHWPRNESLYQGEKIVLRQTSDKIVAALDLKSYFVMDSVLVIKLRPESGIDYRYLLAILNSNLSHFLYRNITQEEGRAFAQVKPQNIKQLLVKPLHLRDQVKFVSLVTDIMRKKDNGEETSELERRINLFLYKTYELNYQDACFIDSDLKWMTQEEYENFKIE
jgi:hypothetical protein